MDWAHGEGRHVGRPRVTERARVMREWPQVRARIEAGELSRAVAARELGVGRRRWGGCWGAISRTLNRGQDAA